MGADRFAQLAGCRTRCRSCCRRPRPQRGRFACVSSSPGASSRRKGCTSCCSNVPADFDAAFTIHRTPARMLAQCRATAAKNWIGQASSSSGRLLACRHLRHGSRGAYMCWCSRRLRAGNGYGLTLIEALSQGTNILAANRRAAAATEIIDGVPASAFSTTRTTRPVSRVKSVRSAGILRRPGTLNQSGD